MEGWNILLTWRSLDLADSAVRRALNQRLAAEAHCSLLEHDALAWLGAAPGGRLRMLELADRLGVTPGGLTRIIDRLVERGWIKRDRSPANRREVYAMLTPAGHDAMGVARSSYVAVLSGTLGGSLDEDDLSELRRITGKLLDALTGKPNPGCP